MYIYEKVSLDDKNYILLKKKIFFWPLLYPSYFNTVFQISPHWKKKIFSCVEKVKKVDKGIGKKIFEEILVHLSLEQKKILTQVKNCSRNKILKSLLLL